MAAQNGHLNIILFFLNQNLYQAIPLQRTIAQLQSFINNKSTDIIERMHQHITTKQSSINNDDSIITILPFEIAHIMGHTEISEILQAADQCMQPISLNTHALLETNFLTSLSNQSRTIIFDYIKHMLPEIIKTKQHLCLLLPLITISEINVVFSNIDVPGLIKTIFDLNDLLKNLNLEQCEGVCHSLGNYLSHIINSVSDFENLLSYISETQRIAVCTVLTNFLKFSTPDLNNRMSIEENDIKIEQKIINILSLQDFYISIKTITSATHADNILLALQEHNYPNIKAELNQILHETGQYILFSWYTKEQRKQIVINIVLSLSQYWLEQINKSFDAVNEINPFKFVELNDRSELSCDQMLTDPHEYLR